MENTTQFPCTVVRKIHLKSSLKLKTLVSKFRVYSVFEIVVG